ncbi:MAG: hypothetical protein EPO55_00680 [Reyranella sp.]|uniref:hypothetical protein n=1 Tax=Reyranella sp. TaxID=1929291 RepID=UPI00121441AA|nr:hypothetical protein [Reyranella sp.]TAJ42776.1 MAG: hypothetical protein EPO55_00680 [Reyranella sp.]
MSATNLGFLLPEVLLAFVLAGAGFAMMFGARRLAAKLIAATLVSALAVPMAESFLAQLPAPVRVLAIVIGALLAIGALMPLLFGRQVWTEAKAMVLAHLLISVGGAILRSRILWTLLFGGVAVFLYWSSLHWPGR